MTFLTVLSAQYGISAKSLKRLYIGEGWEFEEEGFKIERCHQKAVTEIGRNRLSPYVIAYALWCREKCGPQEDYVRYENIRDVARARGFSLTEAISEVFPKLLERDRFPTAQYWLDRATGETFDRDAVERIARYCRTTLSIGPTLGVEYAYLAVRLLYSLPIEVLPDYPRRVQRALNLAIHYGFLDGCHTTTKERDGTKQRFFHAPKFDL